MGSQGKVRQDAMGQKLGDTELELYRRVDEVLYYVWDPIGVAPNAVTRDEYQRYLPEVFAMLQGEWAFRPSLHTWITLLLKGWD